MFGKCLWTFISLKIHAQCFKSKSPRLVFAVDNKPNNDKTRESRIFRLKDKLIFNYLRNCTAVALIRQSTSTRDYFC